MELVSTPIPVERLDYHGARYYAPVDYSWAPRPSSTTILNIKHKPFLMKWYKEKGRQADILSGCAMMVGGLVHSGIDRLVQRGELSKPWLMNEILHHEFDRWQQEYSIESLYRKVSRMLDGFVAFWGEKNPEPLASEIMLYHHDIDWAGTADLVAQIKLRKNSKKPANLLVDYKTGGKYEEHPLQLASYALLWNAHFPDDAVTHVANLYLTDGWRKSPSYKFAVYPLTEDLINRWLSVFGCWEAFYGDVQVKKPEEPTCNWQINIGESHGTINVHPQGEQGKPVRREREEVGQPS